MKAQSIKYLTTSIKNPNIKWKRHNNEIIEQINEHRLRNM